MNRVAIETERLHLEIAPDVGAGISAFSLRAPRGALHPLMRPAPAGRPGFNDLACYTLVPWCNRIAGARFRFSAREHVLRPDWPDGTAIHGDGKDRPWRLLDRSPVAARFELDSREHPDANWPWPYLARIRYDLLDDALAIDLSVRNLGASPMPAGLGLHPYWMRRLHQDEDGRVRCAVRARYPADRMIPTGPPRPEAVSQRLAAGEPLGAAPLDDVFECQGPGSGEWGSLHWPGQGVRLRIDCSANMGHAVVFSPRQPWFCLEPVTMVNDGFNLMDRGQAGTGVSVLAPGESLAARVVFTLEVPSP